MHRMRMLGQIINAACIFSALLTLSMFGVLCYRTFSERHVDLYIKVFNARVHQYFCGKDSMFEGRRVAYFVSDTERFLQWTHHKLFIFTFYSFLAGLVLFVVILLVWSKQGSTAHRKQIIAGNTIAPEKAIINSMLRKKQASSIKLMNLPLVKDTETQHILFTGTTGSGKTNAMQHICHQIRDQKAVIVDTNGSFLDKYYDPRRDIVLNPFDPRFPGWDIWGECTKSYHYDEIAANLIPETKQDPFWTQSSRILLSNILKHLYGEQNCSVSKIMEYANSLSLQKLHEKLAHTGAASLIDPKSEKTALSIRTSLASHIACLGHLMDQPSAHAFSIRNWVQDPSQNGWLFIHALPPQRESLRPLLSCFVSVAMKSLMECNPDKDRRLWFMIDELPSLHKLSDLPLCLAEGRKYGACMALGVQNIPQLEELYGHSITKSLIDLCSTKVFFRCASFAIAQQLSGLVGMQEYREMLESLSYGVHDTRDGVSLHTQTRETPVIPPYELMNLPNYSSFVQLPQGYPIAKIKWDLAPK